MADETVASRPRRIATDTGGTFTDLVIEFTDGTLGLYKSPTVPSDPVAGVLGALDVAAVELEMTRGQLLGDVEMFMHATTHPINSVLEGKTARTALIATEGFPDMLLWREGGRTNPFDSTREYLPPYVSRSLTWEARERVSAEGEILIPLDEERLKADLYAMRDAGVESIAVCLIWSIAEARHELRIGELIEQTLPGIPYTLSHRLNPIVREYRRAVSTAIDASLKPLMHRYLSSLDGRLREAGFHGRLLMVTSTGGVMDIADVAEAPIHALGSGPAMAPVAARHYSELDVPGREFVLVADTGGTSYDVSLVRRGHVLSTNETWLGEPFFSDRIGFPAVDVKSIGAGGGSIAWIDDGGMLHVGPQSAGATPGPICYSRGGTRPTVTDAAVVLGYLDPEYFLGGAMSLDLDAARAGIREHIAEPLGISVDEGAAAILRLATEYMVGAIEEITLNQGIDPRQAVLVGGGGAAGINSVAIASRLGCSTMIIPPVGAVLSAAGALLSDLIADFRSTLVTTTTDFAYDAVRSSLEEKIATAKRFAASSGVSSEDTTIEIYAEARYFRQVWEIEVKLPFVPANAEQLAVVEQLFHDAHRDVFAISDDRSPIEFIGWHVRARCRLRESDKVVLHSSSRLGGAEAERRELYFPSTGRVESDVFRLDSVGPDDTIVGPAVLETPFTTVVINPGTTAKVTENGSLVVTIDDAPDLSSFPERTAAS